MNYKRITLFSGHYGSGKTNVAVNFANNLSKQVNGVTIYDLDIVNPYFRTVDALKILEEYGVELVVSPFAETNVDIPAMNAKSYQMVDNVNRYAVVDLGGDDRGALALGRFSERIIEENNYDLLLVVNKYRPETADFNGVLDIKNEIERSARMNFTGIVNNSNLGSETTAKIVLDSVNYAKEISQKLNLPLKFTAVRRDIAKEIKHAIDNVLEVDLIKYGSWI